MPLSGDSSEVSMAPAVLYNSCASVSLVQCHSTVTDISLEKGRNKLSHFGCYAQLEVESYLITHGSEEVSQQNQGKEGEWDNFCVSAVWICFDINNLEPFFLIITGIVSFYLIKLMESLLAPDLEQVFHILPLGRQNVCLAPGTIPASWTVQVMKDCWGSL